MNGYRPYKFQILPVIQRLNEDDEVVEEMQLEEPVIVFGIAGLHRYADTFELDLAARLPAEGG